MSIDGLVTVAFVDVEGSTALINRLGDPVGTKAVQRQLERVRRMIVEYDGFEVKSLGDGLLVTFPSPSQAVRWGLACQRLLIGTDPALRFGINTGEVVSADGDPLGSAVNAASRITARAEGGTVLVSDVVRQLCTGSPGLVFADRGRVKLRGFTDRWHLWAAGDDARDAPSRVTLGRSTETNVIDELIASTVAGAGATTLIEGEAGIGKSHLATLAGEHARAAGVAVVEWTADEITRRAGALAHVIASHRLLDPADQCDLLDLLRRPTTDDDPVDRSFAVVEACVDAVESLSRHGPVLVVAEDLHWADDLSLAVLRAFSHRAGLNGVAVIATMRPTPKPTTLLRIEELVARAGGHHLVLGALDAGDMYGLAATLAGAPPGERLRRSLDATGGNPLFVMELIRAFDDEGQLLISAGVADVSTADLPAGLHATIRRRLATLPAESSAMMRLASLLGTSFTLAELAAVADRSVIDVASVLREASEAGLVVGDGERLTFRHDVVRESVYASMTSAERRDLHRAAGAALARHQFPTQQIAWQFALGAGRGDVVAVEWLDRAGTEVLTIAPGTACDLFERALELAPPNWPGLGSMQARMIEPLAWCARFDRANEVAAGVLATSTDHAVQFAATRGMSAVFGNIGDIGAAIEMLKRSTMIPDAPADEVERELCMAAQLEAITGAVNPHTARTIAADTLAAGVARHDATTQCLAHQTLSAIDMLEGRAPSARTHLETSLALYDSGHVRHASYLIPDSLLAIAIILLDEIDDGLQLIAHSLRRYEQRGALSQLPMLYMTAAAAHMRLGRWDDAVTAVEAGQTVVADTGSLNFVLYLHAIEARIRIHRGELDRAQAELTAGGDRLAHGSLFGADWLMDAQVQLLATTGQPEAALALGKMVWEQTVFIRHFYGLPDRVATLVRLAASQGDHAFATEVVEAMAIHADRTPTRTNRAISLHCRGLSAGDPEPILEAADVLRTTPFKPALAIACEDAAVLLATAGRREPGITLLREAAAITAELGAVHDSERIAAALEALDARPGPKRIARPTFGWESITDVERRVCELASQGLTNPQIGSRLHISRRTVETHLAHVYRKLDLTGRAQLASEFTRRHEPQATATPTGQGAR